MNLKALGLAGLLIFSGCNWKSKPFYEEYGKSLNITITDEGKRIFEYNRDNNDRKDDLKLVYELMNIYLDGTMHFRLIDTIKNRLDIWEKPFYEKYGKDMLMWGGRDYIIVSYKKDNKEKDDLRLKYKPTGIDLNGTWDRGKCFKFKLKAMVEDTNKNRIFEEKEIIHIKSEIEEDIIKPIK